MGWLFGRKKKQLAVPTPPHVSHEQSLNFNEDSMHDKVIHPSHIKAAAGVHDDPFNFQDHNSSATPSPKDLFASAEPPSQSPSLSERSRPKPSPSTLSYSSQDKKPLLKAASKPNVRHHGNDIYIKVQDYKRILGNIKELSSELTDVAHLTKELEHSEYNEEKNFLRMKDSVKKVHDKLLTADRTLFAQH